MFKTWILIIVKQLEEEFHTQQNTNYCRLANVHVMVKSNKIKPTLLSGAGIAKLA